MGTWFDVIKQLECFIDYLAHNGSDATDMLKMLIGSKGEEVEDPLDAFVSVVRSIECSGDPRTNQVWYRNAEGSLVEVADSDAKRFAAIAVAGVYLLGQDFKMKGRAIMSLAFALQNTMDHEERLGFLSTVLRIADLRDDYEFFVEDCELLKQTEYSAREPLENIFGEQIAQVLRACLELPKD